MQSSVTKPSSSAVRVVIGGMTMRFLISTGPIRDGVRRMFIQAGVSTKEGWWRKIPSSQLLAAHFVRRPPSQGGRRVGGKMPSLQHRNLAAVEIDRGAVQPAGAGGDGEHHEAAHVLDSADTNRIIELAQQLFADFLFGRPGALDLRLDPP